jgi:glycosyltransferase involved in cell wall biosynthesis
MPQPVSLVLIAKNAERTLARCLDSTRDFADVVLLDTGSTDRSLELARSFPHVRVLQGPFVNFSDARNRAAALARHDWIVPVDTDEWLSPELTAALLRFAPGATDQVHAFWRINWFAGQRLRSRLGREWIRRVYHRGTVRFEGAVHERLVLIQGGRPGVAALEGQIFHEPYASVGHLFEKRWFYAQPELRGPVAAAHPFAASLRAGWRFLRAYLLHGGFMDGWRGFTLAAADAYGVFLKYVWGYAERRSSSAQTRGP